MRTKEEQNIIDAVTLLSSYYQIETDIEGKIVIHTDLFEDENGNLQIPEE